MKRACSNNIILNDPFQSRLRDRQLDQFNFESFLRFRKRILFVYQELNKPLMKSIFIFLFISLIFVLDSSAANYTVTNTNDAGSGSLRQAILYANSSGGSDNIVFAIPGVGPHTIVLVSALPVISGTLNIDGYTQQGSILPGATWPAKIQIVIDGNGLNAIGLEFIQSAPTSSVKGLSIVNFGNAGIHIDANNITVAGNFIGLLPDGSEKGNEVGIYADGGDNCIIGGPTEESRNVISGNSDEGLTFVPGGTSFTNFSTGHMIRYNYVGTNIYGTAAIGNGMHGIDFDGANNSYVLDNVVGGSGQYGIGVDATYSADPAMIYNVTIMRNRIGIGVNGEDIGNTLAGIMVINAHDIVIGSSIANANIIAYNGKGVIVKDWPSSSSGSCYNVQITYNRIFSNNDLGIDLNDDGVTLNDVGDNDTGPNKLLNFPVITSANVEDGNLTIKGTLDTDIPNSNFNIVFFNNPNGVIDADPSGYGENYIRIGLISVTTDGNGDASFTAVYPPTTEVGHGQANYKDKIVAFARSATENTSEYSHYYEVTAVADSVNTLDVNRTYSIYERPDAVSYEWTVPIGATITSGQGNVSINVDWTGVALGSYEVKVKSVNSCGESVEISNPVVLYQAATDLAISISDFSDPVFAGNSFSYTITVTNTSFGAIDAKDVVVTDVLPSGLTLVSASPSLGSWASSIWDVGTLAAGTSATLTLNVTVNANYTLSSISNSATVSSTTTDLVSVNNSDTETTTVNTMADLSIVKSFTYPSDPIVAGELVTFTISGTNNGPSDAADVIFMDINLLLSDMQYSLDLNTWLPWTGTYNYGVLAANNTATGYVRGRLLSSASGNLSNTASVSSLTSDNDLMNNSVTISSVITQSADLSINKVCNTPNSNILPGNEVQYTLTISNDGPSDASDFTISDAMSSPSPFVASSIVYSANNGVTWSSWSGLYINSVGLANGNSTSILIKGTLALDFTGTLENTATVSSTTSEPIPDDNTSTVYSEIATVADLSLTKTGPSSIIAGNVITYSIVVTNNGSNNAQNVVITDHFNNQYFSNVAYNDGITSGAWNGSKIYPSLVTGNTITLTITATVNSALSNGSTISNSASVNSSTYDSDNSNNSATYNTSVTTSADLSIAKVLNTAETSVFAGQTVDYKITISNSGPSLASNYQVLDQFSSGMTPLLYSTDNGANWIAWPVNNIVETGNLVSGGSTSIIVRARIDIDNNSTISNTASISSSTTDPVPGNNSVTTSSVQVLDQTPPSITCYADLTVGCISDIPSVNTTSIVTSDNFGGVVTVTHVGDVVINRICSNNFTILRTYKATDASGNFAKCTQSITIRDNTPPAITCPPDITGIQCDSSIPLPYANVTEFISAGGTLSDECGETPVLTLDEEAVDNLTCANRFTLTRTYRVTDACGNYSTCNQKIYVDDTTPPTFTVPDDITLKCSDDYTDLLITGDVVDEADNCSSVTNATYADDLSGIGCNGTGTIVRTWTLTGRCTNSTVKTQYITIYDNESPVITCVGDQVRNADAGVCAYTALGAEFDYVTASDNCGILSITNNLNGASSLAGYSFNPGVNTVIWTITDNCGVSNSCSFSITVTDNEKPVANCKDITVNLNEYGYTTITANDINNGSTDNCNIQSLIASQTSFNCSSLGLNTVSLTVIDGNGNSDVCDATVTVTDTNAPTLSINDTSANEASGSAVFTVSMSNARSCDVTFTVNTSDISAVSGSDYSGISSQTYIIPAGALSVTISVPILADNVTESVETFSVNISDAVNAKISDESGIGTIIDIDSISLSIDDIVVDESAGTATFVVTLLGNTQDVLMVDYSTSNGTALAGDDYVATSGTISFPSGSANGATRTITVQLIDDNTVELTETFKITLSNIVSTGNTYISDAEGVAYIIDKDVIVANDLVSTNEDTPIIIIVLNNDTFASDDIVVVSSISDPSNGTAIINGDGTITYTPDPNFNGTNYITYTVVVTNSDGSSTTETAIVTINVLPVNDSPVAVDDMATIGEGRTLYGTSLLANDSDPDGNILTINTIQVSGPSHGTLLINPNGTYVYTPDMHYIGTDVFTYQVCDNGMPSLCATATVTINVTLFYRAPVAIDDIVNIDEDNPITIDVLNNDVYPDGSVSINDLSITAQPINGTAVIDMLTGEITYTPSPNYYGSDSFVYQICNLIGLCDEATVWITVNSVNDSPVVQNDYVEVDTNTLVIIKVIENDSDPDGVLDISSLKIVTLPTHGTVTINSQNGEITYTPNDNYFGNDSFEYEICDSETPPLCSTAIVSINVINSDSDGDGIPNATEGKGDLDGDGIPNYLDLDSDGDGIPDAVEGSIDSDGDGIPNFLDLDSDDDLVPDEIEGVVDTDGDGAPNYIDPDDDGDTVLTINEDTNYDGDPTNDDLDNDGIPNYLDPDDDGDGIPSKDELPDSNNNGVPDYLEPGSLYPPLAVDDEVTTGVDAEITIYPLANDSVSFDPDKLVIIQQPAHGTITVNLVDGSITYTPASGYKGTDVIVYEVCNEYDECDQATITIIIEDIVIPPQIFTPNGDGQNDTYIIKGIEHYPENRLIVYNRWGNVVYDKKAYLNEWDGTSNQNKIGNKPLPVGTYYYLIIYGKYQKSGYVFIDR